MGNGDTTTTEWLRQLAVDPKKTWVPLTLMGAAMAGAFWLGGFIKDLEYQIRANTEMSGENRLVIDDHSDRISTLERSRRGGP